MNGTFKTCPRCKGLGYILGQRKQYKTITYHLPNYKKNKRGLCFLCDGKKEAFFTNDNKVIKVKRNKFNEITLVEFSPIDGALIGEMPKSSISKYLYNTDNTFNTTKSTPTCNFVDNNNRFININKDLQNKEDIFFPKEHELILGEYSSKVNSLLKQYSNARVVSIDRFLSDSGDTLNFLMYYDKDFNLINPSYAISDIEDECSLLSGVVLLDNNFSIAVSGTYYPNLDKLYLGIKTKHGFNAITIQKVFHILNIYKNKKIREEDVNNFINNITPVHPVMIKILLDILNYCHLDIEDIHNLAVL